MAPLFIEPKSVVTKPPYQYGEVEAETESECRHP